MISRAKRFEPVTLVRSPIMMKLLSGRMVSVSRPESCVMTDVEVRDSTAFGSARGGEVAAPPRAIAANVIRRRSAAAADDVDEAGLGEIAQQRGRLVGQLVVFAERIRQSGVRIAGDVGLGDARQLRDVRAHLARAERAVEADAERLRVADRRVERVDASGRTACGRCDR